METLKYHNSHHNWTFLHLFRGVGCDFYFYLGAKRPKSREALTYKEKARPKREGQKGTKVPKVPGKGRWSLDGLNKCVHSFGAVLAHLLCYMGVSVARGSDLRMSEILLYRFQIVAAFK